jgi:hypothetical protein
VPGIEGWFVRKRGGRFGTAVAAPVVALPRADRAQRPRIGGAARSRPGAALVI